MLRYLQITFAIVMAKVDREDQLLPSIDHVLRATIFLSEMSQRIF